MRTKATYDPCCFFDLGTLLAYRSGEGNADGEPSAATHPSESCAGKTLLCLSPRGFELLRVPAVLH